MCICLDDHRKTCVQFIDAEPAGWEGWFIGGALANRDNPAVVRGLHEEYFDAGADVATTNNFVATEYTLDKVLGEHSSLEELTRARFG